MCYKLRELREDKKGGTALMLVVLILAGSIFVSLTAGDIVRNGLIMGRDRVYSTKAFFAAEAGAERILYEIRKGGFPFDCDNNDNFCFDGGDLDSCEATCVSPLTSFYDLPNNSSYSISYRYDGKNKIRCTGYYENISRIVELTY